MRSKQEILDTLVLLRKLHAVSLDDPAYNKAVIGAISTTEWFLGYDTDNIQRMEEAKEYIKNKSK